MGYFSVMQGAETPGNHLGNARANLTLFAEAGEGGNKAEDYAYLLDMAKGDIEAALKLARDGKELHRSEVGQDCGKAYILSALPQFEDIANWSKSGIQSWWRLYDAAAELELAFREDISITCGASHGFNGWAMPMRFTDRRDAGAIAFCETLRAARRETAQAVMPKLSGRKFAETRKRLATFGALPKKPFGDLFTRHRKQPDAAARGPDSPGPGPKG